MSDPFVVGIKPSARRTNGAVGSLVNREGTRHEFPDRESAEGWAAGLATRGEQTVWIRRANPNDPDEVDAYLVGRRRSVGRLRTDPVDQATIDRDWDGDGLATAVGTARRVDPENETGEQSSIDRYDGES